MKECLNDIIHKLIKNEITLEEASSFIVNLSENERLISVICEKCVHKNCELCDMGEVT